MTINYVCPMHPEIQSSKPGKCSICGMSLVAKDSVDKPSYLPLLIITGLVAIVSVAISFTQGFTFIKFISTFMVGFFLVFSGFKLIDLKGFKEGYETYDLLAKRVPVYGFGYP